MVLWLATESRDQLQTTVCAAAAALVRPFRAECYSTPVTFTIDAERELLNATFQKA